MSSTTIILLRIVHIVSGVFWVGSALFVARFLLPSLRAVGPAAGPVMQQLNQTRKLPVYLMGAMLLTILSGITLIMHDSSVSQGAFMSSSTGRVFGVGGLLALIAGIVGLSVNMPAARRMTQLYMAPSGPLALGVWTGGGAAGSRVVASVMGGAGIRADGVVVSSRAYHASGRKEPEEGATKSRSRRCDVSGACRLVALSPLRPRITSNHEQVAAGQGEVAARRAPCVGDEPWLGLLP